MQRSKNDVWVGLFVLIGAAAILFLALQSANLLSLSFQATYRVNAKFDNVVGSNPKRPYAVAGLSLAAWNPSRLTTSLSRPRWQ